MKRIALRSCQLRAADIIPVLKDKPLLTNLGIGGNHIDDSIIETMAKLPLLEAVDISNNKEFTGRGLENLSGLSNLTNIVVNDSSLSDQGLSGLSKLKGIKYLPLTNTKVTDAGLSALPSMPWLETCSVRYTTVSVRGLQALRSSPKLRHIEFGLSLGIKDVGELAALKDFPNLQEIVVDMGGPKEKENIAQMARLGELAALPLLKRVEVWCNYRVKAPPPAGLDLIPNLEFLQLNSAFTDDDVALLKPLKQLRYLRLNGADLTENGALKLVAVSGLREINAKAFTPEGLKAFKGYRPDVRIID
jgi:hypothetical protein